jgi:hypothetical protein
MISEAELRELEATLLPALERHHLRLLAHGLRTLQAVGAGSGGGLPPRAALEAWAAAQPAIAGDAPFRSALVDQLLAAGVQLESIAAGLRHRCGPLDLELADLVQWSRAQADRRLTPPDRPPSASPPPG